MHTQKYRQSVQSSPMSAVCRDFMAIFLQIIPYFYTLTLLRILEVRCILYTYKCNLETSKIKSYLNNELWKTFKIWLLSCLARLCDFCCFSCGGGDTTNMRPKCNDDCRLRAVPNRELRRERSILVTWPLFSRGWLRWRPPSVSPENWENPFETPWREAFFSPSCSGRMGRDRGGPGTDKTSSGCMPVDRVTKLVDAARVS